MSKKYSGENTLSFFMQIVKNALKGKIDTTSIADNLTTDDATKVLSAKQGKLLKEQIANAGGGDMLKDTYDHDDDGVVDNAKKIDNKSLSDLVLADDFDTKAATYLTSQKGQANGVVPLGANGKISSEYIPGGFDNMDEVYVDTANNKLYKDAEKTEEVTPVREVLYVDLTSGSYYRWTGTELAKAPDSSDMVEITNEEVTTLWNNITV